MKSLFFLSGLVALFFVVSLSPSCMSKKLEPFEGEICDTLQNVTYDGLVKPIIDSSCAYVGCHDGGPSSIVPGNIYTDYNGMLQDIQSGSFEQRVIDLKDEPVSGMPPDLYQETQKADLTQEELDIIQCWINAGYPEN